ncbi:MAG: Isoquinoline 1-oxidoreductase subunit [Hyphomicrobium sp.]|nr:Isoquinoline 1-oxidoreductase subunit [Hyphomicrobium sp.]
MRPLLLIGVCLGVCLSLATLGGIAARATEPLTPADEFQRIDDPRERAIAAFREAGRVLQHPRCLNCHPAGERPRQGMDMHIHQQGVVRGEDGLGATAMRCTTCHGSANFDPGGVPGHPMWHLAPIEMAWEGKSLGEICEQIKDPQRNGGKSLTDIVKHMTDDTLVGWAWTPGRGREPVPGTQREFGALFAYWAENGAHCPTS